MARPRKTLEEFFWARVVKSDNCWEWTGKKQSSGHGQVILHRGAKQLGAHRVSWEIHNGSIPKGMYVCHKCDNPSCMNPDHLFIGTNLDNIKDMWAKGRGKPPPDVKSSRTECPKGHPFDEQNTYHYPFHNGRRCRECHKLDQRRARKKQKGDFTCL